MDNKLGRNDPCHCGSGKKYKKCCLQKDAEKRAAEIKAAQQPRIPDFEQEESLVKASEIDSEPTKEVENTIVDLCWERFEHSSDPEAKARCIEEFLDKHPESVQDLDVVEMLLAFESELINSSVAKQFIALLERIKSDFPEVYREEAAYIDFSLIHYLVANKRYAELPEYLRSFKEHPLNDIETLFAALEFLKATDCHEAVVDLVHATYDEIISSDKVFGGDEILSPLLMSYYQPYLDKDLAVANLQALSAELNKLQINFMEGFTEPERLAEHFHSIMREPEPDFLRAYPQGKPSEDYYATVMLSFLGYLYKEKNYSLTKADYFSKLVLQVIDQAVARKKRHANPFNFQKNLTEQAIIKNCQRFVGLDFTRALSLFSALFLFAEFLYRYEALSLAKCEEIQSWMREWHEQFQPDSERISFETQALREFPL